MTVPSRVLARCLVALVSVALLLTQGAMILHLLLVPHVTCEHGELVDAGRIGEPRRGVPRTPPIVLPGGPEAHEQAVAAPSDGSAAERSDAPSSEHDHCDALALRHRVPDVATPVAEASLLAILPLEATSEGSEVRAVPLLALAPKASPPGV